MRLSALLVILVVALLLHSGCDSPGEPYRYRDLKIYPSALPSLTTPGSADTVRIDFGLFNTDLEPMEQVEWQAVLDAAPTAFASGTVDHIAAQSWIYANCDTSPGLGSHTITIILDPNHRISGDRDQGNNTQTVILLVADANLTFPAAPVVAPAAPTSADPLTITADIQHLDLSGHAAVLSNVVVKVQEAGLDVPGASATIASLAPGATGTVTLTLPAATVGTHTYSVIIDPAATIPVRSRGLATISVTVTVVPIAPG